MYVRDTGMLHALLQFGTEREVMGHPKLGSSWEGFAMEEVFMALDTRTAFFWATHAGAELDLLVTIAGRRYGFEFKYADAPSSTRSMHVAIQDLGLEHLWIVYPGHKEYGIKERVSAVPLNSMPRLANRLAGT